VEILSESTKAYIEWLISKCE